MLPEHKRCPHCELTKPSSEFNKTVNRGTPRLKSLCKPCDSANSAKWRKDNRKKYNAYFVNRRRADPEFKAKSVEYISDWNRRHLERKAEYVRRHHALTRGAAAANVTPEQWAERLIEFNHHCAYCLRPFETLEQEHMMPVSRGGDHSIDNLIPACPRCNKSKGRKSLLEFCGTLDSTTNNRKLLKVG